VPVVREHASVGDVVGVAARRLLHEEVGLRHRPGLGVDLLPEKVDLRSRVDRGADDITVSPHAEVFVLLGDHEHAAGAAAGVVDSRDDALPPDAIVFAREHEIDHEVDHVARGEVLSGVLVQGFVELANQLLEDGPHGVLSKSNFSRTSRMLGLKPAM
jgi:hypothetical protein